MAAYEGWAMLELMGHRQRIGWVQEVEQYGGKLLRIDIPTKSEDLRTDAVTEFYGCTSIYAMRPISEDIVRDRVKREGDPRPVRPVDYRIENKSEQTPHYEETPEDHFDDDEPLF